MIPCPEVLRHGHADKRDGGQYQERSTNQRKDLGRPAACREIWPARVEILGHCFPRLPEVYASGGWSSKMDGCAPRRPAPVSIFSADARKRGARKVRGAQRRGVARAF